MTIIVRAWPEGGYRPPLPPEEGKPWLTLCRSDERPGFIWRNHTFDDAMTFSGRKAAEAYLDSLEQRGDFAFDRSRLSFELVA